MITKDNLIITGIDQVTGIKDFKLEVRPNQHAACSVKLFIPEELPHSILDDQILSIVHRKDDSEKLLFKGIVSKFAQKREGGQIEASLFLQSASIRLDHDKVICPFQNTEETYKSLIKRILDKHAESDVLFSVDEKEKQAIGDLVVQYQETDWEFCKRIASHFGSVLIPDIMTGQPKFFMGFQKGISVDEHFFDYTTSIDKRYYLAKEYSLYSKEHFVFYQTTSEHYYPVGTQAILHERSYCILSLTAELTDGIVVFTYEFGLPALYETRKYDNADLTGASLTGTVIESDAGTVKVVFDINQNEVSPLHVRSAGREEGIQKSYPWTPVIGNIFSCLPEPGEKVSVLFKSADEADAIAIESYRGNDIADCSNITSSADRYFTTTAGKELKLIPDAIGVDNHTGNSLLLDDQAGISFRGKTMELGAKGNIIINGNKITAFAPLQTTLIKGTMGGGSINICQDFNTSGKIKFLAQATPYAEEEPVFLSETVDISTMERQVIGMIPTGRCEEPLVHQALGMLVQG